GEAEHGAADEEGRRKLRNAVLAAFQQGAGEAEKGAIEQAATDKTTFKHVAAASVESLADKASADRAATALIEHATAKAFPGVNAEVAALNAIANLIRLPAGGNPDPDVNAAGTNWLTAQFEEAAQPASSKAAQGGDPVAAKAQKIAHLLYHIDG